MGLENTSSADIAIRHIHVSVVSRHSRIWRSYSDTISKLNLAKRDSPTLSTLMNNRRGRCRRGCAENRMLKNGIQSTESSSGLTLLLSSLRQVSRLSSRDELELTLVADIRTHLAERQYDSLEDFEGYLRNLVHLSGNESTKADVRFCLRLLQSFKQSRDATYVASASDAPPSLNDTNMNTDLVETGTLPITGQSKSMAAGLEGINGLFDGCGV